MELTWRWFGPKDPITLPMLRQIGVEGIVTALHNVPLGQVWPRESIRRLRETIEAAGLRWSVVESLPVTESIKCGAPDCDAQIEVYKESLRHLGAEGVRTVCYNFMPVLDWARTDLAHPCADGTTRLFFSHAEFACFDIHILQRAGAREEWAGLRSYNGGKPRNLLAEADALAERLTEADRQRLVDNIIVKTQGFVSGNISEGDARPVERFRQLLARYDGITPDALRHNLRRFLSAVVPVAEEVGVRLCIHPDDPPFPVLGLPRIVTSEADIDFLLSCVPSTANGLTFCAGSLSAGAHNDVVRLARKYAERTHFVHLRSCAIEPNGDFCEASHLGGRADVVELARIFSSQRPDLPMRVDHGPCMLGDERRGYNAGYSFHGRAFALAQVQGILAAVARPDTTL